MSSRARRSSIRTSSATCAASCSISALNSTDRERIRVVPFRPERANSVFVPAAGRYEAMRYRRVGASGIELPLIAFGLWQNFGDDHPLANSRAILRRAFDL